MVTAAKLRRDSSFSDVESGNVNSKLGGHALPGGAVILKAYESLVDKTLDSLKKHLPYDGLYFDIHGAMSVTGLEDPEGDFIERIRKVVGTKTIISTQKIGYSTTMLFAAAVAFLLSSVISASLTSYTSATAILR